MPTMPTGRTRALVYACSCSLAWLAASGGCESKRTSTRATSTQAATGDAGVRADQGKGPGEGQGQGRAKDSGEHENRVVQRVPRAQVQALVDRWLEAQNKGDFAAYAALYSEDFRGVRRSGKKTVRLDHAGWLADRKKMFKRAMRVELSALEIEVGRKSAEVRFVQEWASGSYRDVGPKVIRVVETADGLRITGEEMLASMLLAASDELPLLSEQLGLVYEGQLVLADEVEVAWASGPAELLAGRIVPPVDEVEPDCVDDPPDYETDNSRYFECLALEPISTFDRYIATRPVPAARAPKKLAAWHGREVTLFDAAGASCPAKVGDLELRAEWQTTGDQVIKSGRRERAVAEAVLERGNPVLVAELAGGCKDPVFARAAGLPPPPRWTIQEPGPALRAAALKELSSDPDEYYGFAMLAEGHAGVHGGDPDPPTLLELAPPGQGRRFVAALADGPLDCHEAGFAAALWEVTGTPQKPRLERVFDENAQPFRVRAAADVTGDGVPEIVLDDGVLLWQDGEFAHFRPLAFPKEVHDECYCECE